MLPSTVIITPLCALVKRKNIEFFKGEVSVVRLKLGIRCISDLLFLTSDFAQHGCLFLGEAQGFCHAVVAQLGAGVELFQCVGVLLRFRHGWGIVG